MIVSFKAAATDLGNDNAVEDIRCTIRVEVNVAVALATVEVGVVAKPSRSFNVSCVERLQQGVALEERVGVTSMGSAPVDAEVVEIFLQIDDGIVALETARYLESFFSP
ncbi:MAG: hypothetical protein HC824_19165, partial [Synechococcales cyanobacterium RM1_1_8]|nr:hypothetical protein [Synechococcales cyanobacterium RM1_1_8]